MIKTKIIETTEKYDKDDKLVERIIIKQTSEDDKFYESGAIYYPQEPKKTPCDCKLKAEDVIKVMNDYSKRTVRSAFLF